MMSSMNEMHKWASKQKPFILPISKVKDAIAVIKSTGGEVIHHCAHIVDRPIPCECTTAELSTSSFHIRRRNSGATGFFVKHKGKVYGLEANDDCQKTYRLKRI